MQRGRAEWSSAWGLCEASRPDVEGIRKRMDLSLGEDSDKKDTESCITAFASKATRKNSWLFIEFAWHQEMPILGAKVWICIQKRRRAQVLCSARQCWWRRPCQRWLKAGVLMLLVAVVWKASSFKGIYLCLSGPASLQVFEGVQSYGTIEAPLAG